MLSMRMASGVSLGEPVAEVEVFSLDEPSPRESGGRGNVVRKSRDRF